MFAGFSPLEGDVLDPLAPHPITTQLPSAAPSDSEISEPDAGAFNLFEQRVIELDKALRKLANEARQLGSSVGIVSASFRLCERLARILFLFHMNASCLFPHRIRTKSLELNVDRYWNFKRQRRYRRNGNRFVNIVARISSSKEQPKPEDLPAELALCAKDIATLLDCFSQFPDFVEEVPEQSLEQDLKVWAERLKQFEDDIETPAVRRYVHDLSVTIGGRLKRIREFIPIFTGTGVKTIRGAQKHSATNLINLSTVATLFSGVTATMIQFSYVTTSTAEANAVNGFWFISLVFSISAAVNSLLGLTWMQAIFRSPDHRVPWWVLIWIRRSPLIFLVMSVACFFIGLVLFVYTSGQSFVTCVVTAVLSAICCFGLTAMSLWFAFERWVYNWHDGHKLLSDAIRDAGRNVLETRPVAWCTAQVCRGFTFGHKLFVVLGRVMKAVAPGIAIWKFWSRSATTVRDPEAPMDALEAITVSLRMLPKDADTSTSDVSIPKVSGRKRFIGLVNRIIAMQKAATRTPRRETRASRRQITQSSDLGGIIPSARVNELVPKLKNMGVALQRDYHNALVRDIQFSPDGSYLATSSWDKTTLLLDVSTDFTKYQTLAHPTGFVSQVEWSPDSSMIITKMNTTIKLWSKDGQILRSIVRKRPVQSVRWLPDGQGFLSVEDDGAVKIHVDESIRSSRYYTVENMEMSDVAVTKDQTYMVFIGSKVQAKSSPSEDRSGMNEIILYSLKTCTVAKRAPLFHDASDITLACDNQSMLVSFNGRVPSQLWKLHLDTHPSITLKHTYTSTAISTAKPSPLPSIFGGEDDHLVLRAEAEGDILIWDRESANLLHHVRPPPGIGHLSSLAWNASVADTFMFATGSHDGAVRVWTVHPNGHTREASSPRSLTASPISLPPYSPKPHPWRLRSTSSFGIGYKSESPISTPHEDASFENIIPDVLHQTQEDDGAFSRREIPRATTSH